MARFEFKMPDVGEGLADVEVIAWFVKVGDRVQENQPIADVETDKAIVTMPAPATGRVIELAAKEGERVKVGAFLLAIETGDEEAKDRGGEQAGMRREADYFQPSGPPASQPPTPSPQPPSVLASPVARKLAHDLGIALEEVTGTGPKGRINAEDVQRHAEMLQAAKVPAPVAPASAPAKPVESEAAAGDERIPVRGLRRRIAEVLTETARTVPQVVGFHEFDADALVKERAYLQRHAEAVGVRLTYLPFIIKACVEALKQHPYLNACYMDGDDPAILLKKSYNIGIATATDDGLVVPVLHGADQFDLFELARRADELVAAARERRTTPKDMQHGTFTITNVGQMGGWFGTSILRAPEAAILGVGKIEDKAVVRHGQIVARPILPLSLTFDHRVIDGQEALAFIQTLRRYLEEDPRSLSPR
ncbi:MAG: 2-oxo acid dehydrogenase subunit E2 [Anaerolineales bacterium]|nr:2-oxo acid dehydrogenase subunit E2 [Anaerolineales bacterium]